MIEATAVSQVIYQSWCSANAYYDWPIVILVSPARGLSRVADQAQPLRHYFTRWVHWSQEIRAQDLLLANDCLLTATNLPK
ncbi:hypothetical protein AG1IA_09687 [Rhizoctonia solani AG-1 IA]|uniref:Uncharacterized protein n=1 Tax=Thanatephorus cucumeris (strain AG1-IA) TaxID=983506 RepID=L8WHN7_THACA|nr:hypothetical protein AG1IA_09687 [Rhizoctonia solani AG-1 IA]